MDAKALERIARRAINLLDPSWEISRALIDELAEALRAPDSTSPSTSPAKRARGASSKRGRGKKVSNAGAIAGDAWAAPNGICYRLAHESDCKTCDHGRGDHAQSLLCACGCTAYTRTREFDVNSPCGNCEHDKDDHDLVWACNPETAGEACACTSYAAKHEMGYNIAVEFKRLVDAGEIKPRAYELAIDAKILSVCACGHDAGAHAKDALENLLKCGARVGNSTVTDLEKGLIEYADCDCDHFHYSDKQLKARAA